MCAGLSSTHVCVYTAHVSTYVGSSCRCGLKYTRHTQLNAKYIAVSAFAVDSATKDEAFSIKVIGFVMSMCNVTHAVVVDPATPSPKGQGQ